MEFEWPNAKVGVNSEPPADSAALIGLEVKVMDTMKTPTDLGRTMTWPAELTAKSELDPGALVASSHGCYPDAVNYIRIQTCPLSGDLTMPPAGCLHVTFDHQGIGGAFTQPDGTSCSITGGQGNVVLTRAAITGRKTPPVSAGTFAADCGRFELQGTFELVQFNTFLLCAP